jgi:competence protein ComEA
MPGGGSYRPGMRKESADEVALAARRRLALLGRELALAGLTPGGRDEGGGHDSHRGPSTDVDHTGTSGASVVAVEPPADVGVVDPVVVLPPGRHARGRAAPLGNRGVAWLQDRLPATLQGRVSLGAGHVAVLAVVAAAALAVTAFLTIRARPTVDTLPDVHTSPASSAVLGPSTATAPTSRSVGAPASAEAGTAGSVVVDVAGKVRRPGVATLPAGSRVVDAIRRAGGARPGVDLSSLNLARVLVDGEQILVGVAAAPGVAASASSRPGTSTAGGLVNLNTAGLDDLETLPGVGPVTAQKILDWRTSHGAFTAVDELLEVDGIGEKTLAELAPHVTL